MGRACAGGDRSGYRPGPKGSAGAALAVALSFAFLLRQIDAEDIGYLRKNTVYISIQTGPLFLVLLNELLWRQDNFFFVGITA